MFLTKAEPVNIGSGKSAVFAYALPDECRGITVSLARCTSQRPDLWASDKTIVRWQTSVLRNGNLVEDFSADTWEGGIKKWLGPKHVSKDEVDYPFEVVGFPIPMLCDICGTRFLPGSTYCQVSKADNADNMDYMKPVYDENGKQIGSLLEGILAHSTVDLKAGVTLAEVLAVTDKEHLKNAKSVEEFKMTTLPRWEDKRKLDRTFHDPVCADNTNRSVAVTVEVLSGPDLASELTVEAY